MATPPWLVAPRAAIGRAVWRVVRRRHVVVDAGHPGSGSGALDRPRQRPGRPRAPAGLAGGPGEGRTPVPADPARPVARRPAGRRHARARDFRERSRARNRARRGGGAVLLRISLSVAPRPSRSTHADVQRRAGDLRGGGGGRRSVVARPAGMARLACGRLVGPGRSDRAIARMAARRLLLGPPAQHGQLRAAVADAGGRRRARRRRAGRTPVRPPARRLRARAVGGLPRQRARIRTRQPPRRGARGHPAPPAAVYSSPKASNSCGRKPAR